MYFLYPFQEKCIFPKKRMHFFLDHHESKLPDVKTTIFTTMNHLAKENNTLNLSQGFPDFDCPINPEPIVL